MNKVFLVALFLFLSIISLGQNAVTGSFDKREQVRIKKQLIVNDLENKIKDVPYSAPRVLARYKIASWLWKDGKDDTGRAEELAVTAVEDLFKNQIEIPRVYLDSLLPDLFALLDRNSPDTARKLRKKYDLDAKSESGLLDSLLAQKGGDKLAVDSAIRSLFTQDKIDSEVIFLLGKLQQRRSPELLRLLDAIVAAEEAGRSKFRAGSLVFLAGHFAEPNVPRLMEKRFLKIVIGRSSEAAQLPDGDIEGFFDLLGRSLPAISEKFSELLPEANVVNAVLMSRISRASREARERNERIDNSSDKLAALISEAERTDEKSVKYELLTRAVRLALDQKQYVRSVDLIVLSSEIDMSSNPISEEFRSNWRNQVLKSVTEKALESEDDNSALYAIKKMSDAVTKAESFGRVTRYYVTNGNMDSARSMLVEALRFAANVEDLSRRASIYVKLLPTAQKIDTGRVFEVNRLAAKSINAIPSLNIEDKPETENYQNYVTKVMIVNWNLLPALTGLIKVDRNGAADLAGRIEKKEIRIIADYVMAIESIDIDVVQDQRSATSPN